MLHDIYLHLQLDLHAWTDHTGSWHEVPAPFARCICWQRYKWKGASRSLPGTFRRLTSLCSRVANTTAALPYGLYLSYVPANKPGRNVAMRSNFTQCSFSLQQNTRTTETTLVPALSLELQQKKRYSSNSTPSYKQNAPFPSFQLIAIGLTL